MEGERMKEQIKETVGLAFMGLYIAHLLVGVRGASRASFLYRRKE